MNACIALCPPPPSRLRSASILDERQVPVLGLARQNKDYVPAQLPGVDETSLPGGSVYSTHRLQTNALSHALTYVGARSRLHTYKQAHTPRTHTRTHACTHTWNGRTYAHTYNGECTCT
jgi:hypothetical protein